MIRLIQDHLNHPYGNCYGTSIFSIFELDPRFMPLLPENDEEINKQHLISCNDPQNCHYSMDDKRTGYWHWMWEEWFNANNLTKFSISYNKLEAYAWPKVFHIINGRSPRDPEGNKGSDGRAMYHTVVGLGGLIWHDPHPSGTGLLSIETLEFLIPADYSKPILQGYLEQVKNG